MNGANTVEVGAVFEGAAAMRQHWTEAAVKATTEVAVSLGLDEPKLVSTRPGMPNGLAGSTLAMVGKEPFQLGLFSGKAGCQTFARALLGLDPSEEVPTGDLADAHNEVLNMVAGVMKRVVSQQDGGSIKLGLPVFIEGRIVDNAYETTCALLKMGDHDIELLVLFENQGE